MVSVEYNCFNVVSTRSSDNNFLAPPACKVFSAAAFLAKKPVASRTISTPSLAQSICSGSRSAETLMNLPLTSNPPSLTSTVPSKRPLSCVVFQQVCKHNWICKVVDTSNFQHLLRFGYDGKQDDRYVRNR